MSRSRLPVLGIAAGALLAVGSLLAFTAAVAPASGTGGNMAAPAAQATTTAVTPTVTLTGTLWEWTNTETGDGTVITATDPSRYTVEFLDGGQMAIKADCNRGSGTYVTNGSELVITPGAFTRIGCPPDTQDQVFLRDLGRVSGYLFIQGKLILQLPFDSGSMTFREAQLTTQATPTTTGEATPAPPPAVTPGTQDLTNGVWQWQRTDMNGGTSTVPDPARYTLEFLPDRVAYIRADCNMGNASYVLTGANGIDITPGVFTLVACPPGSLDTLFVQQLEAAITYEIRDGALTLGLAQGGNMVFVWSARIEPPPPTPEQTPLVRPTATAVGPEVPGMPRTGAKD